MSEPARPPGVGRDLTEVIERLTSARFAVAFRGYEPREVHDLLSQVSAALQSLAERGSSEPAPPVPAHGAIERAEATATSIIRAAKEGSERRIAAAREEADQILSDARGQAERLVRDALAEADRVLEAAVSDADALRREAAQFRDKARAAVLDSIREANLLLARGEQESRKFTSVGILQPVPDAAAGGEAAAVREPGAASDVPADAGGAPRGSDSAGDEA